MRGFTTLLVCAIGLGIGAGTTTVLRGAKAVPSKAADSSTKSAPDTGVQEVAVFVGASWCRASAFPELKDSLPNVLKKLEGEAKSRNHWFTSIGVSLDQPARKGIDWLGEYANFGELIVGGGWANYGAIDLIWSDSLSVVELPQLIVLSRPILASSPRMKFGPITIRERLRGVEPIIHRLALEPASLRSDIVASPRVGR
jgi:hypothetical protein